MSRPLEQVVSCGKEDWWGADVPLVAGLSNIFQQREAGGGSRLSRLCFGLCEAG